MVRKEYSFIQDDSPQKILEGYVITSPSTPPQKTKELSEGGCESDLSSTGDTNIKVKNRKNCLRKLKNSQEMS